MCQGNVHLLRGIERVRESTRSLLRTPLRDLRLCEHSLSFVLLNERVRRRPAHADLPWHFARLLEN